MQVIQSLPVLRDQVVEWRSAGDSIVFVPTMGNLHAGHMSLVQHARALGSRVIVSIYVNPTQFGINEDFGSYPRTLEQDCRQLLGNGADMVFTPDESTMYPLGTRRATHISVPGISSKLDGKHRPGHFDGVATVVCRLFAMVAPDVAVFGQKDFQQLMIIRQMTTDLSLPIDVVGAPTVREADGLAMSSRNQYLGDDERARAPIIYRELCRIADALKQGRRDFGALRREAIATLQDAGFKPDYVAIRDPRTLRKSSDSDAQFVVLVAAMLGQARLIDNLTVGVDD